MHRYLLSSMTVVSFEEETREVTQWHRDDAQHDVMKEIGF